MSDSANEMSIPQEAVFAAPTFFVDGHLGVASAGGVARVTLAAYKLNVSSGATTPLLHPVATIAVPERSLLAFAREMLARAEEIGVANDGAAS